MSWLSDKSLRNFPNEKIKVNNLLFYGDNLEVMRSKIKDETIDLCYIDPPFNSKRNYFQIYNNIGKEDVAQAQAFIDIWTWNELAINGYQEIITNYQGCYTKQTIELMKGLKGVLSESPLLAYIVGMTQRINEIQRVMKPTGSFYLHCDPTASHYLKLALDSVFCPRGGDYLNEIVWKRSTGKSLTSRKLANDHDVIFNYSKSQNYTWNNEGCFISYDVTNLSEKTRKKYCYKDSDGRMYRLDNLANPNPDRPNLTYEFLGFTKVWRWTKERMNKAYEDGLVIQTKPGNIPCLKRYLDEQKGRPIGNVWDDIPPLNSQAQERLGYPTQKPESLLERIIQASSNEGDTVLDAFCGCGTSVAVAHRLRRQWMGIDITYQSIAVVLKRLEDSFGATIFDNLILNGIPKDMDSAIALANKKDDRLRKEFEKWAVLIYTNNRAAINDKKGADKGVDGYAYMMTSKDTTERIIFQVKSGGVSRNSIATLRGDMQREEAKVAILITLEEPTKNMKDEAASAGFYHHELMGRNYPSIQIVTVREMLEEDKRIELPLNIEVLKSAMNSSLEQQGLLFSS